MSTAATRRSVTTIVFGFTAGLILSATSLGAQGAPKDEAPVDAPAAASAGPDLRGEALRAIAEGKDVGQTAERLVRRAVGLAVEDLERARTLQLAARLYWYAGDLERTRRTLTRAGRSAYRADAPRLAVRCFLDAAEAAREDGDERAAWIAGQRAGKVIHGADFGPEERLRMLARVVYTDQPASLQTSELLAEQR